jgi:hypothetical protein
MAISKEYTMRFILIFYLAVVCTLSTQAAATKAPRAAPVSINIRTAGDLADACTVSPNSKSSFARLNFCNGFAQGTLQTNNQNSSGAKICMPKPTPKRSETMKEFASWVRADISRKDEVASVAFLRTISMQVVVWIVLGETYAANRHHPCGAAQG